MKQEEISKLPFVYGVQYYRAPTPGQECWQKDLKQIKKQGFDTVKFWVQWRWSERDEGVFYWDDLDELMRISAANGLRVVLNLILDVMPDWVEKNYTETLMVDRFGHRALTQTTLCRQIGGYPGPCHNNRVMREKRERFTREAVRHFKSFPALWSWDVWNEPERHLSFRSPDHIPEFCYCESCSNGFREWLRHKYLKIEKLNDVWGRCYSDFADVEIPQNTGTVNDFIDWREYQAQILTKDAQWRLQVVEKIDPQRHAHLHIVPDAGYFSALNGVDDFALGRECGIFGASMINEPYLCAQATSAANGNYFYNAEWHINYGGNAMYQRIESREHFLFELLPQLGWGVRGFLYWQYRAETLGLEAPAWGLVRQDGSSRPVTGFAQEFADVFGQYASEFMNCSPPAPQVFIYRSVRNQVFQFCRHRSLDRYNQILRNYSRVLYEQNVTFAFADKEILQNKLKQIKVLILPQVYYVTHEEAELFDHFLQEGGVIFSENNLAAYSSDTGRFCDKVPGCGLSEQWGIAEIEATSSYHLPTGTADENIDAAGDVSKALEASGGSAGSEFFIFRDLNKVEGYGAVDFALPAGDDCETIALFQSFPCAVQKRVGKGTLFYVGTMLGYGAGKGNALLRSLLTKALEAAGLSLNPGGRSLHTDLLTLPNGEPRFMVCSNMGNKAEHLTLPSEDWHELFGRPVDLVPPHSSLLFINK